MSMISKLCSDLRNAADEGCCPNRDRTLIRYAADTIEALSAKVADQNLKNSNEKLKSENPCGKCQMSLMEKSTCCGCPERIEWEKQYKQNIPSATSKNLKEPNKSCEVDDVIYKQAAIDTVSKCLEGRVYWRTIFDTKESLESLPSADRPTGKWDKNGNCTNCGEHAPYWAMATTYYRSNYCPNCGAKMKGETK